jgi:hypothetical protein
MSSIKVDKTKYPYRRYWPVPVTYPPLDYDTSLLTYQNVNADKTLQNKVTKFFYKKLLSWIYDKDSNFFKFKNILSEIETNYGITLVHKLLKKLIKITNINWYDLKDNYNLIKKYLFIKLNKLY